MTRAPLRYAILLIGIVGLSMAGVFYKLSAAPVATIVAYRMLMATLLTVPLALMSGVLAPRQGRVRFGRADVAISALSGIFFALDILLWAASIQFTTVASAALVVSTDPIFVALLAWVLFHERPSPLLLGGIAIGVAGMLLVVGHDMRLSGRALLGDGLAICAALCETGYLLVGRHVRQRIDAPRYTLVVYAASAAVVWLVVAATRTQTAMTPHDFLMAFALAAVVTMLGHSLISQSLGHLPAAVVAASFLAQPILSALAALAFIHQAIAPTTVLGGLVALAGIGIVAYANERREPQAAAAVM